jgi:ABC-type multidrug transport system fused ATPase/permease subunit
MFPAEMIMFSIAHKLLFNAVEYGEPTLYIRAIALVVIAVFITCGIQPITSYVWTADIIRGNDRLRRRVVSHALRLQRSYFDEHHSGDTLSRMTRDLDAAREVRERLVDLLRPA